jgi:predicted histidine transporter YuiF (NhaC family)
MFGIATPTEISSFAVLYGAALALFVYREMGASGLMRTVIDSAALSGMVLFILAAASAFSWVLTIASLPQALVELLHHVNNSSFVFLIGSILLLVVAGSLLEGLPALNVLAPLLLPVATQIGISPLHYGIVLVIAMGIGAFMPPAGVGFSGPRSNWRHARCCRISWYCSSACWSSRSSPRSPSSCRTPSAYIETLRRPYALLALTIAMNLSTLSAPA